MANSQNKKAPRLVADLHPDELADHRRLEAEISKLGQEREPRRVDNLSPQEQARYGQQIAEDMKQMARKEFSKLRQKPELRRVDSLSPQEQARYRQQIAEDMKQMAAQEDDEK